MTDVTPARYQYRVAVGSDVGVLDWVTYSDDPKPDDLSSNPRDYLSGTGDFDPAHVPAWTLAANMVPFDHDATLSPKGADSGLGVNLDGTTAATYQDMPPPPGARKLYVSGAMFKWGGPQTAGDLEIGVWYFSGTGTFLGALSAHYGAGTTDSVGWRTFNLEGNIPTGTTVVRAFVFRNGAAGGWANVTDLEVRDRPDTRGLVLDGLQLARALPADEPWPAQPLPSTLSFQVAADTTQLLADQLVKGNPLAFRMAEYNPAGSGTWVLQHWWVGRITDVAIEARDGYALATVTGTDWVTALGEVMSGDQAWPLEAATNRFNRLMAVVQTDAPELPWQANYSPTTDAPLAGSMTGINFTPAGGEPRPVLELLTELLRSWPVGGPFGGGGLDPKDGTYAKYELQAAGPNTGATWLGGLIDGLSNTATGLFSNLLSVAQWVLVRRRVAPATTPPGVFVFTSSGWGITWHSSGSGQIPAGDCDVPVQWSQRIGQLPNIAVLHYYDSSIGRMDTLRWRNISATLKPRVRIKRDLIIDAGVLDDATYQSGGTSLLQLAIMLVPIYAVAPRSSWQAAAITWHASMHDGYSDAPQKLTLGELVTVTDVDPASHPAGKAWITGQVANTVLKVTNGLPVITFVLRPQLRDSSSSLALTMANVSGAIYLGDIAPSVTLEDLRLLRNP